MDDPRTVLVADDGDLREMIEQCVDQRPRRMTLSRVDYEVRRLVDDHDIGVDKNELEGDALRDERRLGLGRLVCDVDPVPRLELIARLSGEGADPDAAGVDDLADLGPAQPFDLVGQKNVEPDVLPDLRPDDEISRWHVDDASGRRRGPPRR